MMHKTPKITRIISSHPPFINVLFENNIEKSYNCSPLIERFGHTILYNKAFFSTAHVDPGGYGISWNGDIDVSEYEIWNNGEAVSSNAETMSSH